MSLRIGFTRLLISALTGLCFVTGAACLACCSLDEASFTNTIGFVSESHKDGKRIHILAYKNVASNQAEGGNAMFLPIPAVSGSMSENNIVNTETFSDFMDKMQENVTRPLLDPLLVAFFSVLAAIIVFHRPILALLSRLSPFFLSLALTWTILTTSALAGAAVMTVYTLTKPASLPGSVNVNNLANLETLLSWTSNSMEIGGVLFGAIFIVLAFRKTGKTKIANKEISRGVCIATAIQLTTVGLMAPGVTNWLIASTRDANLFGDPDEPQIFNSGIYTVVLAKDPEQIPNVLHRVPEEKRPKLNPEIFDAYSKWYKGWTFALCCFNNKDASSATPMLWWYEPKYPDLLFFPALDAHNGKPPVLNAKVDVDHCLISATDTKEGAQNPFDMIRAPLRNFEYPNRDKWAQYLPEQIFGRLYREKMDQGDFVFRVKDIRRGTYDPLRVLPPGAAASNIWNSSEL